MKDQLLAQLALLEDDMNFLVELPMGLTIVFQKNAGPFAEAEVTDHVTDEDGITQSRPLTIESALYDFSFYASNCPLHEDCQCYEQFMFNSPDPHKVVDEFIKRLKVSEEALPHVVRFK